MHAHSSLLQYVLRFLRAKSLDPSTHYWLLPGKRFSTFDCRPVAEIQEHLLYCALTGRLTRLVINWQWKFQARCALLYSDAVNR